MPRCPHCGTIPYLTYCPSYVHHVESCRVSFEAGKRSERVMASYVKGMERERLVINNYTIVMGDQINIDYPQSDRSEEVLKSVQHFDLKRLKSVEDLNMIMGSIQDMNDGEIVKCLSGSNKKAQSNALSFLAHVMQVIRKRLQKEIFPRTVLIEAAESFEQECLKDKKLLTQ